jgi:hypothetical protein
MVYIHLFKRGPTLDQHSFNNQFISFNNFRIIFAQSSLVKDLDLMAIMLHVSYCQ